MSSDEPSSDMPESKSLFEEARTLAFALEKSADERSSSLSAGQNHTFRDTTADALASLAFIVAELARRSDLSEREGDGSAPLIP